MLHFIFLPILNSTCKMVTKGWPSGSSTRCKGSGSGPTQQRKPGGYSRELKTDRQFCKDDCVSVVFSAFCKVVVVNLPVYFRFAKF